MAVKYHDIAEPGVREELKKRYGVGIVPTIIIGRKRFIGFENNREEIQELLKIK